MAEQQPQPGFPAGRRPVSSANAVSRPRLVTTFGLGSGRAFSFLADVRTQAEFTPMPKKLVAVCAVAGQAGAKRTQALNR
jgi:hypothetical protein